MDNNHSSKFVSETVPTIDNCSPGRMSFPDKVGNITMGSSLSSISLTLRVEVTLLLSPALSVAVAITSILPGESGRNSARLFSSRVTLDPSTTNSISSTPVKLSARALITTFCPATTGKLGVNSKLTTGGVGEFSTLIMAFFRSEERRVGKEC